MAHLEQPSRLTGSLDNQDESDGKSAPAAKRNDSSLTQVYDLADEEVHFSRYGSDFYYYQQPRRVPGSNPGTSQPQTPRPTRKMSANHNSGASSSQWPAAAAAAANSRSQSIDLTQGLAPPIPNGTPISVDELERASSSKLLNSLGNKLRRSSNYLNAPAKLLGQYLLGITIQSWAEFLNTSRMTRTPCTTRQQLSRRLVANLTYFQGNYLCCSLVLVVYCILTSPLLLLAISAYLMALYLVTARSALGKQTRLLGYRLNLQQQYSFITLFALAPLWIAGAPSAIFWVIGASFFVVGLHASVYAIEQLASDQSNHHHHHHHGNQILAGCYSGGSSLARSSQSLALHTPTHQLSRQGYAQIGSPDSIHYYNHYPGVSRLARPESRAGPAYSQMAPSSPGASSSSSYMSGAFAQWTLFGGSRQASGGRSSSASGATQAEKRVPNVKVISCDYAGLGRVYEV